jgi:hypothetical protein
MMRFDKSFADRAVYFQEIEVARLPPSAIGFLCHPACGAISLNSSVQAIAALLDDLG